MPVQLLTTDNSNGDPRVISLQEYIDGKANFSLHYYYTSEQSAFGGKTVEIPWVDLYNAVYTFYTANSIPANEVALRFVYCFDTVSGEICYRLQLCRMINPHTEGEYTVYDLDDTVCAWYEIKNGLFNTTADHLLFGQEYLDNFYYKTEPQSMELECLNTGPGKYVKNIVFPWTEEIYKMYQENNSPQGGGVHFASCSYMHPGGQYSAVEWPHGMVIFLSDAQGQPLLDDQDYITMYHNKGADFGTPCPPSCDQYKEPLVLE